jgi:hypothetical protein
MMTGEHDERMQELSINSPNSVLGHADQDSNGIAYCEHWLRDPRRNSLSYDLGRVRSSSGPPESQKSWGQEETNGE